eukprot:TRINITY_DN46390_c0_g1_i1.p1 TRINITY_DN46390_c0_g1~~TRINITY_DN46390_c0_g1_i1.p1  ORF type:complete len:348 (+),score=46.01 TRINITY_DN46390_c0_g1_i1:3-1046(+)
MFCRCFCRCFSLADAMYGGTPRRSVMLVPCSGQSPAPARHVEKPTLLCRWRDSSARSGSKQSTCSEVRELTKRHSVLNVMTSSVCFAQQGFSENVLANPLPSRAASRAASKQALSRRGSKRRLGFTIPFLRDRSRLQRGNGDGEDSQKLVGKVSEYFASLGGCLQQVPPELLDVLAKYFSKKHKLDVYEVKHILVNLSETAQEERDGKVLITLDSFRIFLIRVLDAAKLSERWVFEAYDRCNDRAIVTLIDCFLHWYKEHMFSDVVKLAEDTDSATMVAQPGVYMTHLMAPREPRVRGLATLAGRRLRQVFDDESLGEKDTTDYCQFVTKIAPMFRAQARSRDEAPQ